MKVSGPGSIATTPRVAGPKRVGKAKPASGVGQARTIHDVVAVSSIPPSDLTPKVQAAFESLMAEVELLRDELRVAHERLAEMERIADMDPLAPIANRRAFVRELSRTIAYSERYGATSSLVFIDVNDLKEINDTRGHGAGDKALMHVAEILINNIRESDVVGRLGGDEFAVLLVQAREEVAQRKADELAQRISTTPFEFNGEMISVHVAYGVYTFMPGENVDRALETADQRMYEKKKSMKSGSQEEA